jgi:hypothetical protein
MWENGNYNTDITAEGEPVQWGSNWWKEVLISFSDWGSAGGNTETGESWQISDFNQVLTGQSGGGEWQNPAQTPEPATWVLIAAGLIGLAAKKKNLI